MSHMSDLHNIKNSGWLRSGVKDYKKGCLDADTDRRLNLRHEKQKHADAHHDWVCCHAASAAGACARIAIRIPAMVGLGHIHQVALAIEGPGMIRAHDVVILKPALCMHM